MKKAYLATLIVAATATSAFGAAITVTNYDEASGVQKGFSLTDGTALLTGGVVQVGAFANDPAPLIANLGTSEGYAALLTAFTRFGTTNAIGADFSGLFESVKDVPINNGDALVDKSIYTLVGNGATLEASTQLAIIKDDGTFTFDNPLFSTRADLSAASSVIAFGSATGPNVTTALGEVASIQLAVVVPEPMSATLLLGGIALAFRRRKA